MSSEKPKNMKTGYKELNLDFEKIKERIDSAKQGLSNAQWARIIGVETNIVTNIHGKTAQNPSFKYIISVAKALGKPVEYFLYGPNYAEFIKKTEEGEIEDPDKTELRLSIDDAWSHAGTDERGWLKTEIKSILNKFWERKKER